MIADYISGLDHEGMRLIEQCDVHGFASYLERSGNTICGRHPIGVLLASRTQVVVRAHRSQASRFVAYAQSSRVTRPSDSSVSYASALVRPRVV